MHKGARTDLCGGRGATHVPTATDPFAAAMTNLQFPLGHNVFELARLLLNTFESELISLKKSG
jgi:hypothetical protein